MVVVANLRVACFKMNGLKQLIIGEIYLAANYRPYIIVRP